MNYNRFFGFSEPPFLDVPDLRFYFPAKPHEELLAQLARFTSARQGVAVVSGDDGVGKSMLIKALIAKLPPSFHPLVIARPAMEPLAITVTIAQALGITLRERNLVKLTPFAEAVQAAAQQGTYLLVIIDDAQVLTDQHLEEVYILSQMEHQGRQLMPVILAGRKGLVQKVSSKANQRLQELVRQNLVLSGLTFEETIRYIDHRLQQVGSSFKACFAEGCSGQIFSRTGGIPRRVNQVCDQALNRAWKENRSRVSRDLLGEEESPAPFKPVAPPSTSGSWKSYGLLLAGVLAAGLAGLVIYSTSTGPTPSQTPPPAPMTTAPLPKPLPPPAPAQEKSPPVAAIVPPVQPQEKTAESPGPKGSPLPANQGSQGAETKELGVPDLPKVPQPEEPESPPETGKPATHQVTREDGLLKIVATFYPDDKEIGYDAVILANPHITDEDVIYSGQIISLPRVDKKNNVITLDNKEFFGFFRRYHNSTQAAKAATRLKELQLHYVVRETILPDGTKEFRVFLGGYDSKEELRRAMALAENI